MQLDCNDYLEKIADELTNKFKKELVVNLKPYTKKMHDGEKYKQVMEILEKIPHYVELRGKYDDLLEENKKLKEKEKLT